MWSWCEAKSFNPTLMPFTQRNVHTDISKSPTDGHESKLANDSERKRNGAAPCPLVSRVKKLFHKPNLCALNKGK